jgi:hypothetical protein
MGKTVTMRKGDKFADIFDSLETVAQAQRDGYHVCEKDEITAREALLKADAGKNSGNSTATEKSNNRASKINLEKLNKEKLINFAQEKGLFEEAYNDMTKAQIAGVIIEKASGKVIEAGLKTAEEAAALAEGELFDLFDTIGK